jgi:hypothetical protein
MYPVLAVLFALLSTSVLGAPRVSTESGKQTLAVLELYTSEGCSSCPPAEKYLKDLSTTLGKDKQFIPLAFHVDYWDYIGWEDPFAHVDFSNRQRHIAQRNELRAIYTPQFVLYGKDFKAYKNIPEAITVINDMNPAADLSVSASLDSPQQLTTEIILKSINATSIPHTDMRIFITENNLVSNIQDGENAGLEIQHDYVVRHMTAPFAIEADTKKRQPLSHTIQLDPQWKLTDLNLVVFLQNRQNGVTLQAVNLPLKELSQ